MDPFVSLVHALSADKVRFLIIGVWGVNYYAPAGSAMFTTLDRDLFMPAEPENLLAAWRACEANGFALFAGSEPLDLPRDDALASAVVARRALTRASDNAGTDVDLSLVMGGFEFETVWKARRIFTVNGISMPVARLVHIVESKAATNREKDRLFLATHREALQLLLSEDKPGNGAVELP